MGLFGALFAGVAGLGSQSNKIGIVSNNISNVNTVGYKQGSAAFNTLVVPSASTGAFSPGGVLGNNRQLVSQQGLIQATTSVTDVAISGGGLFVVNTKADGTGDTLYTRAGSFTQDSNGNFRNAAGFYLQGLQVQTPALSVNPGNLSTVNVNQNATGSSVSTSLITIAANFNAKQTPLLGEGERATLIGDTTNSANSSKQILIPTTGTSGNGLTRGDSFEILTNGVTPPDIFVYGGFNISRNITSASSVGDGGYSLVSQTVTTGLTSFATAATDAQTSWALNGINVASTSADAVTNGPLAVGNLTINTGSGNINVAVAAGESLATIAANIQAAIRAANAAETTSTAQVVGNPGNYSIVVRDINGGALTGLSTGSTSLPSGGSFSIAGPYGVNDENEITLTVSDASKYTVGRSVYISGITGTVGGVAASDINGQALTIAGINTATNVVTLRLPAGVVTTTAGTTQGGTAITITNRSYSFAGNMLDANATTDDFLGTSGSGAFATTALNFSATVDGSSYTFNYNTAPNTTNGQFNSLSTLATAINTASEGKLSASVVNNQLFISATDATKAVTFTNGDADGAGTGSTFLPGIDWVQELGLQNIEAAATGVNRWNSFQSLADQINLVNPTDLAATVNNPTGISTLDINARDPRNTISFSDSSTNTGSIVRALGFTGVNGNPLIAVTGGFDTGTFTAKYSPTVASKNMSSGAVQPQFTKDITIYDALGINHTVSMNVLKLTNNVWAVEFTANPASEINSTNGDGQISYGTVTFSGDGSLASITGPLASANVSIPWTNGADPSTITFNLGTSGETDGFTQFSGSSNVSIARQNGSPTGQLTGVSIDENGFVTASFSNGQTQQLYQIPLASVNNPNGLSSVSGNAYKQTLDSGEVSLNLAGTNGTGTLAASALEQSNVDLSTQLTDLIVAQQAYGANTRVLTVTSQLLQELNRIIG